MKKAGRQFVPRICWDFFAGFFLAGEKGLHWEAWPTPRGTNAVLCTLLHGLWWGLGIVVHNRHHLPLFCST